MATSQKIKVKVADLIAEIEKRAAADEAAYERRLAEFTHQREAYRLALTEFLRGRAQLASEDPLHPNLERNFYNKEGFWRGAPTPPTEPVRPPSREAVLTQLRMAAEDSITISAQDFAAWIE